MTQFSLIHQAVRALAGVCDGAVSQDGAGLNGFDSPIGKALAAEESLTPRQARNAHKMLRKYRQQLERHGINYDELPTVPEDSEQPRLVDASLTDFLISFPYNDVDEMLPLVKQFDRRSYQKKPIPHWRVFATFANAQKLIPFAVKMEFEVTEAATDLCDRVIAEGEKEELSADADHPDRVIEEGLNLKGQPSFLIYNQFNDAIYQRVKAIPESVFMGRERGTPWAVRKEYADQVSDLAVDFGFSVAASIRDQLASLKAAKDREREEERRRREALLKACQGIEHDSFGGKTPREYQTQAVYWMLDRKQEELRGGILADDMGLGKTLEAALIARAYQRALGADVFVICPVSLRGNWQREAIACQTRMEVYSWAKLPAPPSRPFVLICDEAHYCFPADTQVITDQGVISIGEIVENHLPARVASVDLVTGSIGFKPITEWYKFQSYTKLVRVKHEQGEFTCTADHPIWTEENGYMEAAALTRGAKLRILRQPVLDSEKGKNHSAVLLSDMRQQGDQQQIRSERGNQRTISQAGDYEDLRMAQMRKGISDQVFRPGDGAQAILQRAMCKRLESNPTTQRKTEDSASVCAESARRQAQSFGVRAYETAQSDDQSSSAREDEEIAVGTHVLGKGRQRQDDAAARSSGPRHRSANGACDFNQTGQWSIPITADTLQSGFGSSHNEDGDRDRRQDSSSEALEVLGSSQGRDTSCSRVVSVEILELGSGSGPSASGQQDQFIYCIEVADNHNFFADGVLVSNCQNMKAQRTQTMIELAESQHCLFVLHVSGTPMRGGRPIHLFPLLRSLNHPIAKDKSKYEKTYCGAQLRQVRSGKKTVNVWDTTGASHLDELIAKTSNAILRRKKQDVAKDLPAKTRVVRPVDLSADAQDVYKQIFNKAQEEYTQRLMAGTIKDGGEVLVLMNHVRRAGSVAKVEATIEIADEVIEQGGQPAIFTEFTEPAQKIADHYRAQGLGVELLTGGVTEDRQGMVDRFQAGKSRVWVSTIKAGGVGLTLTAANTVILVDRPWMVDDADQAEDRLHRIGLQHPVTAIWIQANATDEKIDLRIEDQRRILGKVEEGNRKTLRGMKSMQEIALEIAAELFGGAAERKAE